MMEEARMFSDFLDDDIKDMQDQPSLQTPNEGVATDETRQERGKKVPTNSQYLNDRLLLSN